MKDIIKEAIGTTLIYFKPKKASRLSEMGMTIDVDLDLEGFEDSGEDGEPTGIKVPYIVTIDVGSSNILSIRRNYKRAWSGAPYFKENCRAY